LVGGTSILPLDICTGTGESDAAGAFGCCQASHVIITATIESIVPISHFMNFLTLPRPSPCGRLTSHYCTKQQVFGSPVRGHADGRRGGCRRRCYPCGVFTRWAGCSQVRRSSGLAFQGRKRSSAGPVSGFPPLRPHSSRYLRGGPPARAVPTATQMAPKVSRKEVERAFTRAGRQPGFVDRRLSE
jgi:hypothetical protein